VVVQQEQEQEQEQLGARTRERRERGRERGGGERERERMDGVGWSEGDMGRHFVPRSYTGRTCGHALMKLERRGNRAAAGELLRSRCSAWAALTQSVSAAHDAAGYLGTSEGFSLLLQNLL
jgi:hypothetical protein